MGAIAGFVMLGLAIGLARLLLRASRPDDAARRTAVVALAKAGAPGLVRLVGKIGAVEETVSPLTGARCVAWQVRTHELTEQAVVAPLVHTTERVVRVTLSDASGTATVDVEGQVVLDVEPTRRLVLRAEARDGDGAALLSRVGAPPLRKDSKIAAYKIEEHVLAEGERACFFGVVTALPDADAGDYRTPGRRLRVAPGPDGLVRISTRRDLLR